MTLVLNSSEAAATAAAFRCLNCGGLEYVPLWNSVPDRLLRLNGRFDYGQCGSCQLLQIREVPANLSRWYESYRQHRPESPSYAFLRRIVTRRCYPLPRSAGARLLDVGCGNGWYLQAMSRRGWLGTGYELDAVYAHELQKRIGLPILSGLEELERYSNHFDLATFNFSFEHLTHPRQTLEAVSRALRPGGTVIIQLPNARGREARLFKQRWFHLDAPRHITFYTKMQLAELVKQMGFEQVVIGNVPVATGFAGSLCYMVFGYLHPLMWYPAILPGVLFSLLIRDGIFRVIAAKTRHHIGSPEAFDQGASCPARSQAVYSRPAHATPDYAPQIRFTSRQSEILGLVAAGLSDKEIGRRLGLTPRTISKHLERMYSRLQLRNRAAAAALWVQRDRDRDSV